MPEVISIHPENGKIFEYQGKPLVLICATEHYGAVMNRPFRFERYLADAREKGQTLTRLFTLFRELQTPINPYSTCKPESPDYISPFRRTGPDKALDGQPKFDLKQWNSEFFDRLHRFLSLAEEYGIVVEVVLFSNTYNDAVWTLNPLNPANNLNMNSDSPVPWQHYLTCRSSELLGWQEAHVRHLVEETNRYGNVIYEICNEPSHFPTGDDDLPQAEEVNGWQSHFIELIRTVEKDLPRKHLIAGQEAMTTRPFHQPCDGSMDDIDFDIVNIHPLPNTICQGRSYDLGEFMSKQLKLRPVRDFVLATYERSKPLNCDEDNVATQYKEVEGWTIHRKRAWTTLFSGAHYDMIDFSIVPFLESGTTESQRGIRRWMGHLSEFIHSIDLVRARPLTGFLKEQPEHTIESVLAVAGEDYCIYLADERELDEEGCGESIEGRLSIDLPPGEFKVSCYSPNDGVYSPAIGLDGGENRTVDVPAFQHDIVIRVRQNVTSNRKD
jgi:hypothetical protein